MKRILVTGGTGLVGSRLCEVLTAKGYEVAILSRTKSAQSPYPTFVWDVSKGTMDPKAFEGVDALIHLAGAGIADKRWSDQRKKVILASRVHSTKLLLDTVRSLKTPLKVMISASATGYYGGMTSETIFEVSDPPANDFLGTVCQQWEEASEGFETLGIRRVVLRTGIVLSTAGGALQKMKTPMISPLGKGQQYMPWIHIDDLCELYCKSLEDPSFSGPYNAVTSEHHTNYSFSKALASAFKRPFLAIGVPAFLLRWIFGEMAIILLEGSRIGNSKVAQSDFKFKYPTLTSALHQLKSH